MRDRAPANGLRRFRREPLPRRRFHLFHRFHRHRVLCARRSLRRVLPGRS